jgi:HemY protein
LVRAELLIVAEDFPEARRALGDLVDRAPDARALTLMAAIEKGEGGPDAMVQGWLTKALTAPRGPQWVCESCNHIHAEWAPTCENCASFDTLTWKRPETPEYHSATGAAMLPLLAGRQDDNGTGALTIIDPEPSDVREDGDQTQRTDNPDDKR